MGVEVDDVQVLEHGRGSPYLTARVAAGLTATKESGFVRFVQFFVTNIVRHGRRRKLLAHLVQPAPLARNQFILARRMFRHMTPVTSLTDAVMTSLAAALAMLLGAIPKLIGFAVIIIIGWLIASAVATAVASILRAVKFNELAQRGGIAGFVHKMGIGQDSAGFIANIAKWFIRLIVLVSAFDALGLPAVSQVLEQLLMWLPNLVVALVVLVIAGLAANALASLVRGTTAESGLGNPDLLASIARIAVWAFAVVVAVNQIGVAKEIVNTLFMATVGALALALGLSFGLGGRDTAAQIVRGWYERGRQTGPQLADAAGHMQMKAADRADGGSNQIVTPAEARY